MTQMPDSARKELASLQRQLTEQQRKLRDINNRLKQDNRSSKTLEARRRCRETQLRINCLRAQTNRRSSDGPNCDSSASKSASRGAMTPRPPTDPPPPRPQPPAGSLLHMPQWSYVCEITPQLPPCICIFCKFFPSDPNGATGLNWYTPPPDTLTRNHWYPSQGLPDPAVRCAGPARPWTASCASCQAATWCAAPRPRRPSPRSPRPQRPSSRCSGP